MTDERPDADLPSSEPEPPAEPPPSLWASSTFAPDPPPPSDDQPDAPAPEGGDAPAGDGGDAPAGDDGDAPAGDDGDPSGDEGDAPAGDDGDAPTGGGDGPKGDDAAVGAAGEGTSPAAGDDEPGGATSPPPVPSTESAPTAATWGPAPGASVDPGASAADGPDEAEASGESPPAPPLWGPAPAAGPPSGDAEADDDGEQVHADDAVAQRAALEAEIDRQLAGLAPPPTADDEDEEHGEPMTVADEADTLVDHLLVTPPPSSDADAADVPTVPLPPTPTAVDPAARQLEDIASGDVLAERSSRGPIVPLVVVGLLIAAVIGVIAVLGGGDDDESPDPTAEVTTTVPGQTVPLTPGSSPMPAAEALGYFQLYGTQVPEHLTRMFALSADGSPAFAYAKHQETLAKIDPQRNAPLRVELQGNDIVACPEDTATGGCVVYSDFERDASGRLAHFYINASPVRDRIALGTGTEVDANGMRIKIISRYVSVSDRIFIAYEVHNAGATAVAPAAVRYLTPEGDTVGPDNDTFREPVQPGTTIIAAAAFGTTEAGGTLVVEATTDGGGTRGVAQIQTP